MPYGMDPTDYRAFHTHTPNEVKHRKRVTSAQLKVLEGIFKHDTKPNAALRTELASQLNMTARGIQVWFQNHRELEKTKAHKAVLNSALTMDVAPSPRSSEDPDNCEAPVEALSELSWRRSAAASLVLLASYAQPARANNHALNNHALTTSPPALLSPYHVRVSVSDHQLYPVSSRNISTPIPGPLPSDGFSVGMPNASSDSERNPPVALSHFSFPGDDADAEVDVGGDTTNIERGGEVTNSPRGPPEGDSFRAVIPDSSPSDLAGSHLAAGAKRLTIKFVLEQPSDSMATSNIAGPTRPRNVISAKKNKSAKVQRKELHGFFVNLFRTHSNIPLDETNKGDVKLPWKNMDKELAQRGLQIVGWPMGVPEPWSEENKVNSRVDKGISGLKAEHVGPLYEAMKADHINFWPLVEGSQINNAPRGVRRREHSTEDDDEGAIRASKKGKVAQTRKKPQGLKNGLNVWNSQV